jgi:hypothetical protein
MSAGTVSTTKTQIESYQEKLRSVLGKNVKIIWKRG